MRPLRAGPGSRPEPRVCDFEQTFILTINDSRHEEVLRVEDGYPLFLGTGQRTLRWTDDAGAFVEFHFAGQIKDLSAEALSDRQAVITQRMTGVMRVSNSDGDSVRNVGQVVTAYRIDNAGDPGNPDDGDVTLEATVTKVSGQRPMEDPSSSVCQLAEAVFA